MANKKAQTVMEYLTTNSWAILVIALILVTLYTIGFFNPGIFVSNQWLLPANFGCPTSILSSTGNLLVSVQQFTQSPINVTAIGCNTNGSTSNMIKFSPPLKIKVGGNFSAIVQCYSNATVFSGTLGTTYRGFLIINYTDLQTGLPHTVFGSLIEKAATPSPLTTTSVTSTSTTSTSSTSTSMTSTSTSTTSTSTTSTSTTTTISTTSTSTTSTSTTSTSTTTILACTNNWPGGACLGSITYTASTTLTSDVNASTDVVINSGITLTTAGRSVFMGGCFINLGTIALSTALGGGGGGAGGTSLHNGNPGSGNALSYGGSGAGGGAGSGGTSGTGGNGGSTQVSGGAGDTGLGAGNGNVGKTMGAGVVTNANILSWYAAGMNGYLEGGSGGGGGNGVASSGGGGGGGGASSYGIYIQAANVIAGTINANGIWGARGSNGGGSFVCGGGGGGGGGAGGVILIAYNSVYTAGTYNTLGAAGGAGGNPATCGDSPGDVGGSGGGGQTTTYRYVTPPLPTAH